MKDIATLKKHIAESNKISEAVNYFFDLTDQAGFLSDGGSRKVDDTQNCGALALAIDISLKVAGDLLDKQTKVIDQIFTEIPKEGFYHGYCILSSCPVPILIMYCADLQVGISAIVDLKGNTNYCRFCLTNPKDFESQH